MLVQNCRLFDLPKISDPRGNLTFAESGDHIPFPIRRVYYLYDVPAASSRAGHAHRQLEQVLIALAGSFDVLLDDGYKRETIRLRLPYQGLYLGPMVWRELNDFSSGSVCLVLASQYYDEADYYRSYPDFLAGLRARENALPLVEARR